MPGQHALLSPSAAARWLACPPSARLCEGKPDTAGEAAAEGTLAHRICELAARKQFEGMNTRIYNRELKLCKENPLYKPEMLGTAEAYVDFLREQEARYAEKPVISIEREVKYDAYVPEGHGTADCIIVGGDTLHIVDYKHGSNPSNRVDPINNPQLMLYALAALDSYKLLYGDSIQYVTLCVVQPRLDNIATWDTTTTDLRNWGETYAKPRAQQAWDGQGEFAPGDHCKWCKVRAECRARYESY